MFRFYPCPDTISVHRSNSLYDSASRFKISVWILDRKSRIRLATGGVFTTSCLDSLSEESGSLNFSKRRTFLSSRVLNLAHPTVLHFNFRIRHADPGVRAVWGVGLRPFFYCDCWFESFSWMSVSCKCFVLSGGGLCDSARGVPAILMCLI